MNIFKSNNICACEGRCMRTEVVVCAELGGTGKKMWVK